MEQPTITPKAFYEALVKHQDTLVPAWDAYAAQTYNPNRPRDWQYTPVFMWLVQPLKEPGLLAAELEMGDEAPCPPPLELRRLVDTEWTLRDCTQIAEALALADALAPLLRELGCTLLPSRRLVPYQPTKEDVR